MDAGALTPLARNERIAAWILGILAAISRWPAVSRTLWDWDEALFALALRDYDVTAHHPHPPGFPLFIALGRAIHALTPLDEFHALQCIAVCASLFVFPAMFFLARQLRMSAFASIAAALLLAFFPNVWFFGGTALSDVPSLVLVLVASALLLRGNVIAGAIVLGIAAGFRPQNLLIGFVPILVAFRPQRRRAMVGGITVAAIVAISYGGAAFNSGGWDAYRAALTKHEQYIRSVDSFLSPVRPGLIQVADDFFLRPYRAPLINVTITLLAAIGLLRLRKNALLPLLIFGPFLLFAWLYLDFHSASRFSIGYMPLYALLAASGIPSRGRAVTLSVVIALMVAWTWPALRVAHTTMSPPVAAIEHIRANVDRAAHVIYVDERLAAHADLLLADYSRVNVRVISGPTGSQPVDVLRPRRSGDDARAVMLREGTSAASGANNFTRPSDRLAGIARKRYFEISARFGVRQP